MANSLIGDFDENEVNCPLPRLRLSMLLDDFDVASGGQFI